MTVQAQCYDGEQYVKNLPTAFSSHCLNKSEKNYTVVEKQQAAIVWGIKYFQPYLYGRNHQSSERS